MLQIVIQNDGTGTEEFGNYDYKILINNAVMDSGRIEYYNRKNGWKELICILAEELTLKYD